MELECIEVYENNLNIEKKVNVHNAIVKDIIEYKVTVTNTGDSIIDRLIIVDTLKDCLKFVAGSVLIDGILEVTANVLKGIDIGELMPRETRNILYKVEILYRPECGHVNTDVIAKFYYDYHVKNHVKVMDKKSNCVKTKIDIADLEICKKASTNRVSRGSVLSYTVHIRNIGTVEAKNMVFMDCLAKEVQLIENSFKVNCNRINYEDNDISIYVGDLKPEECMIITYDVLIHSCNSNGTLENKAVIKFNYNLHNKFFGEKTIESDVDECEVKFGITSFKQISINQNIDLSYCKKDIREINTINAEGKIIECHVIETIRGTSNEGQTLLGYKLIVRGECKGVIEYISETSEQLVQSESYIIPFSTFIVLPEFYTIGSNVDVESTIEDVYYRQIDKRKFFTNISLLINAKIMPY